MELAVCRLIIICMYGQNPEIYVCVHFLDIESNNHYKFQLPDISVAGKWTENILKRPMHVASCRSCRCQSCSLPVLWFKGGSFFKRQKIWSPAEIMCPLHDFLEYWQHKLFFMDINMVKSTHRSI